MRILITGGAGYIGSHCVRLLRPKEDIIVLDNLCKGHCEAVENVKFREGDVGDANLLKGIFTEEKVDAVIHFAAFSNVGESVTAPKMYEIENVEKMKTLLTTMGECGVDNIIFSSSAAIFGEPEYLPMDEEHPQNPVNPYGETKRKGEALLEEAEREYGIKYCALRYFNAAGASSDGSIGESHNPEYHLLPLIFKTALKQRDRLYVFGNDYDTRDGTCVRDYIHVDDLAEAHYLALKYLIKTQKSEYFNLGSENGFTVLEVIKLFERISGLTLEYEIVERRAGDPATLIASSEKAISLLKWKACRSDLETIVKDAWNWEKNKRF